MSILYAIIGLSNLMMGALNFRASPTFGELQITLGLLCLLVAGDMS